MKQKLKFEFEVDKENSKIIVKREFAASKDIVWEAWTDPELLALWWAPKPYKVVTKSMDFREGGTWFYGMVSPEDEVHWCKADYIKIVNQEFYSGLDAFCNEDGSINEAFPRTQWNVTFDVYGEHTLVTIENQFANLSDLEQVISLGFKEGFTMALGNLDIYFEARYKLMAEKKTSSKARVSTYLNFPGNTEEVFKFYQKVFKTEFIGGIQRFGDYPEQEGEPARSEELKKMILHVELPTIGGHILMASDAAPEMGFNIVKGNNVYISLEPEKRTEADRLFNELSAGGVIEMPMTDMFWGTYFGSFTDQFGIKWMVNHIPAK